MSIGPWSCSVLTREVCCSIGKLESISLNNQLCSNYRPVLYSKRERMALIIGLTYVSIQGRYNGRHYYHVLARHLVKGPVAPCSPDEDQASLKSDFTPLASSHSTGKQRKLRHNSRQPPSSALYSLSRDPSPTTSLSSHIRYRTTHRDHNNTVLC